MSTPAVNLPIGYRPSVAALIFDQNNRFLLVELNDATPGRLDFVKGGMHEGETKEQTLQREISEEIGDNVKYQIIEQSHSYFVYDWSPEVQKIHHYRGQARTSFWVKYLSGQVKIDPVELRSHQWVEESDLEKTLLNTGFPPMLIKHLLNEWSLIKDKIQ